MRIAGRKRAIVLIDGEHHPAAVGDALHELAAEYDISAVVFCGGSEKVSSTALADPDQHYGYPVVQGATAADALRDALAGSEAELLVDLADEPIVTLDEKLRLASIALAAGLSYEGPDMYLDPQRKTEVAFGGPLIAVIGTGKRTGKTAVCGHLAALLAAGGASPAIVSMGRGGPSVPQVADRATGLGELLALARRGVHAASDYLEDAVLAGVPAVGCRRVGGGPAGSSMFTNFAAGAELAARLDGVDTLLFEGSGATVPPVRADRTICIAGPGDQADSLAGPLRLIEADLALAPAGDEAALRAARRWCGGEVAAFGLEPTPATPLPPDAVVAFFSTSDCPPVGVEPAFVSPNLARRLKLERDIEAAVAAGCTHFLTELKAAAIDMIAFAAERHGLEVVFARNRPVGVDAELDEMLLTVYRKAAAGKPLARDLRAAETSARQGP